MKPFIPTAFVAILVATAAASPVAPAVESTLVARDSIDNNFTSPFDSNTPSSPEIDAVRRALENAETYTERQNALIPNPPDATNITFTFINNTVHKTTGGTVALGTAQNFPALIGTEVAQAIGWINPCGLNVPHSHPRANEWLTVIRGKLVGGLVLEANNDSNGDVVGKPDSVSGPEPLVNVTMNTFTGMLFPKGETHWQFNPTCEPAVFAAAFDSSDPGRLQVARNFFSNYPDLVISDALGDLEILSGKDIDKIRHSIPDAYAVVMEECAKRCNLLGNAE
ncbi:cupin domain-containing protein [Sarocladium implicatum]|nr:cupin domain-containing protein [Sarocladium implicatum]